MKAFLWVILVLFALTAVGKALWLASGVYPSRTAGETVFDLVLGVVIAMWALALLWGES